MISPFLERCAKPRMISANGQPGLEISPRAIVKSSARIGDPVINVSSPRYHHPDNPNRARQGFHPIVIVDVFASIDPTRRNTRTGIQREPLAPVGQPKTVFDLLSQQES